MANRSFTRSFFTPHVFPVLLDCNIAIGATGAVGTVNGPGISSVTRLAAGVYKILFQDNYNKLFGVEAFFKAPVTGSNVLATALTPGVVYEITALGTTTQANWVTAGVPSGTTAAVGTSFLAAATSSGNGTAKAVGVSGIASVEVVGLSNTQLYSSTVGQGGYIIIKTLAATDASTTTLVATDPASGSIMYLQIYLSNSSVVVQGE